MAKSQGDGKDSGETQANEQQLFDVVLLKDHTHDGELKLASESIKVNEADRNWLRAQQIIAK